MRKVGNMKRKVTDTISIIVFLLPAVVLFATILIAPMVMSAYYSFFDWRGLGEANFVGFSNYKELFTSELTPFPSALKNVFILAGLSVFIQLPISLGLALILGRGIKGERFFLSVNFIPVLISTVVIAMLWKVVYQPKGLLNNLLRLLGILKEGDSNVLFLADGPKGHLLGAVIAPMLWQYVGYHMLLMYAGVKNVSPELREAAMIDGATPWQVDRYIVIPSMKQVIKVCVIFSVTGSLKSYDLPALLAGMRSVTAAFPSTMLMNQMFKANRYGMGSAIAVLLILMCFAFALLINYLFREKDE